MYVYDKLYAACMLVVVLSSINDMSAEDRFFALYFEWLLVACLPYYILNGCQLRTILCVRVILYFVEFSFT